MTSLIAGSAENSPCVRCRLTAKREALSELLCSDRFWRRMAVLFVLATIPLLFLGISYPLIDRTETRVAEISREILVTGDWTTLHLNFQPYYDKPPLLYWLCAACFQAFGATEFSARLVPTLASWCTLVCTVWFSTRWFGAKVGLLSGVVLFLSAGFVVLSRFLASDALLAFFTSLTAFSGYEAIRSLSYSGSVDRTRKRSGILWMILCGVACGLGFLSKGPVIGVLCGVPFLFAIVYLHRSERFHWLSTGWAALSFACVAVPWIFWVSAHNPQYLSEFFLTHNLNRFGGEFHPKPFWFFVPVLLAGGNPWSFMTLPMLAQFFSRNKPDVLSSRPFLYLIATGLWCVLFFSLSRGKLPPYIFPAAASLSMATAVFLMSVLSGAPQLHARQIALSLSPRLATVATLIGISVYMIVSPVRWSTVQDFALGAFIWAAILVVVSIVGLSIRRSPYKPWIVCGTSTLGLSIWLSYCVIPNYAKQTTCLEVCDEGSEWNLPLRENQIITMVEQFPDVPFYLDRNDILNSEHLEKDWIEARCGEGAPLVLFIPTSVETQFLQLDIESPRKMYSNKRFAVYSLTRNVDHQRSASADTASLSQRGGN